MLRRVENEEIEKSWHCFQGSNGGGYRATRVTICVQHFAFLLLVDDNIFVFNKY